MSVFVRLGQIYRLIRAILLQAASMQQDDEIRAIKGEAHPLLAKTLCGELLDEIFSKTSRS